MTTTTNLTPEERTQVNRVLRQDLARAREDLAAARRAQDPDRHFLGLPESQEVIAAYDRVRAAETLVANIEKENRG